nr:immunoglobulin light chain junction region [Macaca mulatta]
DYYCQAGDSSSDHYIF